VPLTIDQYRSEYNWFSSEVRIPLDLVVGQHLTHHLNFRLFCFSSEAFGGM
jgi:hypothetical protein